MKVYPTFQTPHLFLRPFMCSDAQEVARLAGEKEVVDMLFDFDPSEPGVAHQWITDQLECFQTGEWVNFAIVELPRHVLVGSIGLVRDSLFKDKAEIAYWLGKQYWGRGYATEAGQVVLRYGFDVLEYSVIYGRHFVHNPASGRVLEKLGMQVGDPMPVYLWKNDDWKKLAMRLMHRRDYNTVYL